MIHYDTIYTDITTTTDSLDDERDRGADGDRERQDRYEDGRKANTEEKIYCRLVGVHYELT